MYPVLKRLSKKTDNRTSIENNNKIACLQKNNNNNLSKIV